ncbi:hypothetical protein LX32DRAFT_642756, partial [Colletotrichum zoysiae]
MRGVGGQFLSLSLSLIMAASGGCQNCRKQGQAASGGNLDSISGARKEAFSSDKIHLPTAAITTTTAAAATTTITTGTVKNKGLTVWTHCSTCMRRISWPPALRRDSDPRYLGMPGEYGVTTMYV